MSELTMLHRMDEGRCISNAQPPGPSNNIQSINTCEEAKRAAYQYSLQLRSIQTRVFGNTDLAEKMPLLEGV